MNILIKEGRVLDPASKTDKVMDVLIKDGFIAAMEENIDESQADEVIDASGCMVMPGLLILMHISGNQDLSIRKQSEQVQEQQQEADIQQSA